MERQSSPNRAIQLDDSRYPLVCLNFRAAVSDADLEWMIARFEDLLARPTRYALIVRDAKGVARIGAAQRRMLADWSERRRDLVVEKNICAAIVLQSRLARGVFTAYRWLAKPPSPHLVFSTFEDAERWALDMLGADVFVPEARSA